MPLLPLLALFALAEPVEPAMPRSMDSLPAGTVVDKGRIVSSERVMWRPRAEVGEAFEGFVYEFERADGTHQKMAERNAKDFPKGTQVYVVTGSRLTLVDAKTYTPPKSEPAAPVPARADAASRPAVATPVSNPGSVVAPVTVRAHRTFKTIAEARDAAIGDDWNRVYCESGVSIGSRVPKQTCLTLRDWDIRNQEMRNIRDMLKTFSDPGKITSGAG